MKTEHEFSERASVDAVIEATLPTKPSLLDSVPWWARAEPDLVESVERSGEPRYPGGTGSGI